MERKILFIYVIFISILLSITSCEKENIEYSDRYTGSYYFTNVYYDQSSQIADTIYYSGSILKAESEPNTLVINYSAENILKAPVNKNGIFEVPFDGLYGWDWSGRFIDDDLVEIFLILGVNYAKINGIKN